MKYRLEDDTYALDRFDFVLRDGDGDHGFRVDWDSTNPLPFQRTDEAQMPTSATQSAEGAEEVYSGRDLTDSWRIYFSDFTAGAGQVSRDVVSYAAGKYSESRNIDISGDEGLRLAPTPNVISGAYNLGGQVCEFKGLLACSLDAYSPPLGFFDPVSGTFLGSPTIAAAGSVTALTTDGEYLYAAFSSSGGIWRSDEPLSGWELWCDVQGVGAMEFCTGYIYVVREEQLGFITDALTYEPLALEGALQPIRTTFGLTSSGSWVYWGVVSGARSWVFSAQYNPGDPTNSKPFEQYVELPSGFIGSCLHGYLGNIYIGGSESSRWPNTGRGIVYLAMSNGITRLCNLGDDPNSLTSYPYDPTPYDNGVQNICGYGDDLWIVTARALYRWDLRRGGYSHVADTGSYLEEIDTNLTAVSWESDWHAQSSHTLPSTIGWVAAGAQQYTTQDGVTKQYIPALMAVDVGTASPYARSDFYADFWSLRAYSSSTLSPNPERQTMRFDFPGGTYNLDNDIGTTFEVRVARMMGRALSFQTADGQHVARVRVQAGTTDSDESFTVEMQDSTGWLSYAQAKGRHEVNNFRLTLQGPIATLYLNEASTPILRTRMALAQEGARAFTVVGGWMFPPESTTKQHPWLLDLRGLRFCVDGAYATGGMISGSRTLTSFTVLNNVPYLPTEIGLVYLDLSQFAPSGELVTSWSTGRQPGVLKRFNYLDVNHSPLLYGEQIGLVVESDDGNTAGLIIDGSNTAGVLDQIAINLPPMSRVRLRLQLGSTMRTTTPRLTSAVLRYGLAEITRFQFLVDCRQNVKTKTGENYDWQEARTYLDSLACSGAIVELRYAGRVARVRVEAVHDSADIPSVEDLFALQGRVLLQLRELTGER